MHVDSSDYIPRAHGMLQQVSWSPLILNFFYSFPQENTRYNLIVLFITLGGKFYVYMLLWTLNSRDELRILIKPHDVGRVSVGQWSRDDLTTRDVTVSGRSSFVCLVCSRGTDSKGTNESFELRGAKDSDSYG